MELCEVASAGFVLFAAVYVSISVMLAIQDVRLDIGEFKAVAS